MVSGLWNAWSSFILSSIGFNIFMLIIVIIGSGVEMIKILRHEPKAITKGLISILGMVVILFGCVISYLPKPWNNFQYIFLGLGFFWVILFLWIIPRCFKSLFLPSSNH